MIHTYDEKSSYDKISSTGWYQIYHLTDNVSKHYPDELCALLILAL